MASPATSSTASSAPQSPCAGAAAAPGWNSWASLMGQELLTLMETLGERPVDGRPMPAAAAATIACGSGGSSRRPSWSSAEQGGPRQAAGPESAAARQSGARRKGLGKRAERAPAAGARPKSPPLTTYMVQNLSKSTTRHRFLQALNSMGFEGRYDYVHVPTSFQTGRNQGFAFVNFACEEDAARFAGHFKLADGSKPLDKLWRVAPAAVQGLKANSEAMRRGKLARVRSSAHRPLVLGPQP